MKIEYKQIYEAVCDKKVICWSDLLKKLNLFPEFQRYQKEHNGELYSVQKIFMGKRLLNWIDEIFKERIKTTKDKRMYGLKEPYRSSIYGFDCLQSMPVEAKQDKDYMLIKHL